MNELSLIKKSIQKKNALKDAQKITMIKGTKNTKCLTAAI